MDTPLRPLVPVIAATLLVASLFWATPASSDDDRVRGSYIVSVRGELTASRAADIARAHGGRVAHVYKRFGAFAFAGPDAAGSRLARDGRVRAVEPDRLVRATSEPKPDLRHLERMDAYDAYGAGYQGAGVTIAIIDTGVYRKHPVFHDGQVADGKSCVGGGTNDQEGHGTATASNAAGRIGVAHDATIVPVKVFKGANLFTPISKVVCGLEWVDAQNDVPGTIDVVNLSLAFSGGNDALNNAVQKVRESGAVVVAAAGNNGGKTQAPARYNGVIAVTALAGGSKMASFSATGGDMTAPGVRIRSAENGGGYSRRSGTSRSSPMVAGAAAIVLSAAVPPIVQDASTSDDVLDVLRRSGRCPDGSVNGVTGFCEGRWKGDDKNAEPLVDAYCAGYLAATGSLNPDCAP